jgi:hypothetical protein
MQAIAGFSFHIKEQKQQNKKAPRLSRQNSNIIMDQEHDVLLPVLSSPNAPFQGSNRVGEIETLLEEFPLEISASTTAFRK